MSHLAKYQFKPGRKVVKAKCIGIVPVKGVGDIRVYDKPHNNSMYFLVGNKIIKKSRRTGQEKVVYDPGVINKFTNKTVAALAKNGVSRR